jgi:hypothetical protein
MTGNCLFELLMKKAEAHRTIASEAVRPFGRPIRGATIQSTDT